MNVALCGEGGPAGCLPPGLAVPGFAGRPLLSHRSRLPPEPLDVPGGNRRNAELRRLGPSRCHIVTVAGLAPGWFRVADGTGRAGVPGGTRRVASPAADEAAGADAPSRSPGAGRTG